MTLMGLFSKKQKSKNGGPGTSNSSSAPSESSLSPTTEFVSVDKVLPSSPNGRSVVRTDRLQVPGSTVYPSLVATPSASTSKLRLPFHRKRSNAAGSSTSVATSALSQSPSYSPQPPYLSRKSMSAASDVDTLESRSPSLRPHLRPPPSKSAIFAAYGDPQARSTRSLPTERDIHPQPSPSPPVPPKKPHFFHWSKSQPNSPPTVATVPSPHILPKIKPKTEPKAKSKTKPEITLDDITPTDTSSFNLKSFRHVRAPSPTPSHHHANATSSTISLSSPVPPRRPRGESVASNSSQRISVAAFREAQARRSLAGSPVPSFLSPSPLLPPTPRAASRPNSPRGSPQPNSRSQPNVPKIPPSNNRVSTGQTVSSRTYTSDSDSSEASSEEEEESESDHRQSHAFLTGEPLTRRRRTITQRSSSNGPEVIPSSEDLRARTRAKGRAQSEMGHGFMETQRRNEPPHAPRAQSTYTMLSSPNTDGDNFKAVSNANGSRSSMFGTNNRSRASVSTSALTPSAAAKRASVLVAANSNAGGGKPCLSIFIEARLTDVARSQI